MTDRLRQWQSLQTALGREQKTALREHYAIQRKVGELARVLVNHEGWQMFLDHVDANLEPLRQREAGLRDEIGSGKHLGDALTAKVMELREIVGEARAWTLIREYVPKLIADGDGAKDALDAIAQDGAAQRDFRKVMPFPQGGG